MATLQPKLMLKQFNILLMVVLFNNSLPFYLYYKLLVSEVRFQFRNVLQRCCLNIINQFPLQSNMQLIKTSLLLLLISGFISEAFAQRGISYQELSVRNTAPAFFYDKTVLPVEDGDNTLIHFRFAYHALNFRAVTAFERNDETPEDARFFTTIDLIIEIRKVPSRTADSNRNPEIKRLAWNKTAFASTYEQTQSQKSFQEGSLSLKLEPGDYLHRVYIQSDGKDIRFTSNERRFSVPDFTKEENQPIYLAERSDNGRIPLLNFGRTVPYAKDFDALIYLGKYDNEGSYTINIDELSISGKDTSFVKNIYTDKILPTDIIKFNRVKFDADKTGSSYIDITPSDQGDRSMAKVKVPNSTLKNSTFQIYVTKNDTPLATRSFSSLWIDIPVSLLNLDVAIDMMQLIVDQETFRELQRGSTAQKESRFRAFWKERDPEPESDYNPLMVEFYKRVDTAFERFSSPAAPGFQSDRGKTYIRNGEPDDITRSFPTGRPATEVWTYGNRTYVFEATSGFGDFVLVRRSRN